MAAVVAIGMGEVGPRILAIEDSHRSSKPAADSLGINRQRPSSCDDHFDVINLLHIRIRRGLLARNMGFAKTYR